MVYPMNWYLITSKELLCKERLLFSMCKLGAQWLSGRLLYSRPRGRGFEPHWFHCVVARHIYPSLVPVQPMKTRPCLTERLLMVRKESNQTNKNKSMCKLPKPNLTCLSIIVVILLHCCFHFYVPVYSIISDNEEFYQCQFIWAHCVNIFSCN